MSATLAGAIGNGGDCSIPRICLRYSKARLNAIVSQLDPARRNAVEFRYASWWNEQVYSAFREAGIIFCSCSGPRLPDELIRTTDEVYVRCTDPSAGIGIQRTSSWSGRTGLKQVGRREPGSTSIMITMPMRKKRDCYAAPVRQLSSERRPVKRYRW